MYDYNIHKFNIFTYFLVVISEPDDVTVCEGTSSTRFTCVLNGSISSDDVQWYRILKDTGTTERLGRLDDFTVVPISGQNSFTILLFIFNVRISYTGYYWVRLPADDVCNTSFTVSTGKYLHLYTDIFICNNFKQVDILIRYRSFPT